MLSRVDLATFFLHNTWLTLLEGIRYSPAPRYRTVIYQLTSLSHTATAGFERARFERKYSGHSAFELRTSLGNLRVYAQPR